MKTFPSVLSFWAVMSSSRTVTATSCVPENEFDPLVDYFPEKFAPTRYRVPEFFLEQAELDRTTDLLEITYHNNYKIVTNKWVNVSYLLYQCGTTPPEQELNGKHHLVLPVPHKGGIALTQTVQIPPLELLGLRPEIKAYIGDPQWISSPCLIHRMETGDLDIVHQEGSWGINETLLAAYIAENPDIIVLGGPTSGNERDDRVLSIAASQERTNVATFDWIGLYAALYNLEGMANKITAQTKERYECSSNNAAAVVADSPEEKKVVLWAEHFEGYNWSVAECATWDETYYCEYAKHCGATILGRPENVGTEVNGYWYLTDKEILDLGKDADIWIFPSQFWNRTFASKKDLIEQFKAYQDKQVYDTQGGGPSAWHEQRLAEYEVAALDFCKIVGVSNPANPAVHKLQWFRNIFTDPVGSQGSCNAPEELSQPYVPDGAVCTPLVTDPEEKKEPGEGESGDASAAASWHGGLESVFVMVVACLVMKTFVSS